MRTSARDTFLLVLLVVLSAPVPTAGKMCPWDDARLVPWSEPSSWPSGSVPKDNEKVIIPKDRHMLLDTSTASLATITVEAGASLVWGDYDGLVLRTHYILLYGEFHVGSESCRFEKRANIQLLGHNRTEHRIDEDEFGTKAIIVTTGGVLELHGKHKTSWTRLAQTVPAGSDVPCGFVYSHADREANPFAEERQAGLHVMVWEEDGSVFDFQVFKLADGFGSFFATIPDGKIVAILLFGDKGLPKNGSKKRRRNADEPDVTEVIIDLGGSKIISVGKGDSYAFIVRKGSPETAREYYKEQGQNDKYADPPAFLHLRDEVLSLDFQVAASSQIPFELFRVQRTEVAYPILTLAEEVTGWEVGDKIVVASTDFDWQQAEVREIIDCPSCSARQIRVNDSFNFLHFGNFTYDVDQRAEVGMLTRSILIEGVMEPTCPTATILEKRLCQKFDQDTFGGQVRIVKGFKSAHVQGVELYHMGQQIRLGAYPLHFHMCDEAPGQWFRDNSIHHTFSRCVTIHGTHDVEVSGNVCYDFLGHGYFIEDGVEQNNRLDRNLGIGARHGTLLMSDMTKDWCQSDLAKSCDELSVFWLTHPNNEITNNAAAGGEGHGYMLVFSDLPLGMSYDRQLELGRPHDARFFPLKKFEKNTGHSNVRMGLFMDSKISTGRLPSEDGVPLNGIIQSENLYDPRDPPNETGKRVWTEMTRLTFYKNKENMWLKGGNVRVTYSSLADAPEGFAGGTTGTETGTEVSHSIFIGETDNTGVPRTFNVHTEDKVYSGVYFDQNFAGKPTDPLTAVSMYQGPNYIKTSYFNKYRTKSWCVSDACKEKLHRYAGAISWKRDNTYPTMTSSYTQDLKFGFCDGVYDQHWVFHGNSSTPGWEELDGSLGVFVRDADGSLTGAPNAALVRDFPVYKGDECVDRPDWGMSVCPYRYIKMEVLGEGGSLSKSKKDKSPLIIRRDDAPYDQPFIIEGTIRNEYLLRTHRSYLLDFNPELNGAQFPSEFTIFGYGVEKGDVVRVGICQPFVEDVLTQYEIRSDYPAYIRRNENWVDSLQHLDEDQTGNAFFYDKKDGVLYYKILSHHMRTNDSQRCPAGQCYKVVFKLSNVDRTIRSCQHVRPTPFVDNTPVPERPPERRTCTGPDSPEGLGAVNYDEVSYIEREEFSVPCVQTAASGASYTELGCYDDKPQTDLQEEVDLAKSMTIEWCGDRCYRRGYRYFTLTKGKRCNCSNNVDLTVPSNGCGKKCSGNKSEICGGQSAMSLYQITIS